MVEQDPASHSLKDYREQLALLTDRQMECLAWVAQGYKSKDIARFIGISPGRIDKIILASREKLGGMDRGPAGRLVAAHLAAISSGAPPTQFSGAQKSGLPTSDDFEPVVPSMDHADAQTVPAGSLAEEQRVYSRSSTFAALLDLVPLRLGGRLHNDLSPTHITIAIGVIILFALLIAGSAVSLLTALSSFEQA